MPSHNDTMTSQTKRFGIWVAQWKAVVARLLAALYHAIRNANEQQATDIGQDVATRHKMATGHSPSKPHENNATPFTRIHSIIA